MLLLLLLVSVFFFNDTATTEIYTLSLHDALPILLLVAIPNAFEAGQIVQQARAANPGLEIVARAHFDAEVEHLLQHGADTVIMGEREIARSMLQRAAARAPAQSADLSITVVTS